MFNSWNKINFIEMFKLLLLFIVLSIITNVNCQSPGKFKSILIIRLKF